MFKKTLIAGLITGAFASAAMAADAPTPEHTLTGNVGVYSQYIFRGLTQTNKNPALQGGFDYAHASGLYAGTWMSNISWLTDTPTATGYKGGSLEMDFYGGYKGSLGGDVGYDVGVLQYYYPGNFSSTTYTGTVKADTLEAYGALSWKWLSAKYSQSINKNTFGVSNSKNTYYLDLAATVPVTDSVNVVAHYGMQKYDGGTNDKYYSYNDWKVGATYTLPKDYSVGFYYTNTDMTNTQKASYKNTLGTYMGKEAYTLFVSKTF